MNSIIYVQFKVQQEYIASTLCVKKDVPMNTCKGNCYLKAHLQKQDTTQDLSISYLKDKIDLYFLSSSTIILFEYFNPDVIFTRFLFLQPIESSMDIFHPPA